MNVLNLLKKTRASVVDLLYQTKDSNFIGFDKYRNKGAYHWEEMADNDDYKKKLKIIAAHVSAGDYCLDIGCGDGAYMFALSSKCRKIMGVDADYHAIRLAQAKLHEHQAHNCVCVQAPISKISVDFLKADRKFDLVYSMDVIEHLPEPAQLLKVASRVVKETGLVIIGTPIFVSVDLISPYHVKEFTIEEIHNLISSSFKIQDEIIVPMRRPDGVIYDNGFYISVGTPRLGRD